MRPAFPSIKSAAAFALLLLVVLFLPVLLRGRLLPPPREKYLSQGWDTFGDYAYLHRQIFEETNTIDIAFVGSSRIWLGIDTPYVQEQLSRQLGRPAVVETIAWGWGGYDKLYIYLRDLLEHRRVRMLVFNDEGQSVNLLDPFARRWFRFGENYAELGGFPLRLQLCYYFAAIQGIPQNLLGLVRPNLPCDFSVTDIARMEQLYSSTNPASRLGSLALQQGFSRGPLFQSGRNSFEPFTPVVSNGPAEAIVYSAATSNAFQFTGLPMLVSQTHYAKKFAALAREKSVELVLIHLPNTEEIGQTAIPEREFWPATLRADIALLGIPANKLFTGMNEPVALKFFADPNHINQNGQKYFTRLITPALLKIYESSTNN